MACFVVPAAEAIVVTAAYIAVKKREQRIEAPKLSQGVDFTEAPAKIKWSKKLSWLMSLLWGGVLLLAFEHFWHGEITAFPPFLTAMSSPGQTRQMLAEMSTVGVSMAVTVTAVWGAAVAVADAKVKSIRKKLSHEA